MRTMLAGVTGVVVAAALAACGGDKAAERRAAKARWIQHVDRACQKANEAIAERGGPADLIDLDRLVVRGIDDARAAIRTIVREPIPDDAGSTPGAFVRELRALDEDLTRLSEASEELDPHALIDAADEIKPRLAALETRAEAAGLRDCVTHDEDVLVPDAVRAPVFAEQLARLERKLLRRIQTIDFGQASSAGEFGRAFADYARLLADALDGIAKLDPPLWAADQTANYQRALRNLQAASEKFADRLAKDRGKPLEILDKAEYERIQREVDKASLAEARARQKMLRAVGSTPTSPPSVGGEEAPEPEDQAQS